MFNLYKRLLAYAEERKPYAYASMVLSAVSVLVYMSAYYVLWQSITAILLEADFAAGIRYALLVVVLLVLRGLIVIVACMLSHYLGFGLETNLRREGLCRVLDASFAFFDRHSSGGIRKIIDDNAGNTHKTVAHLIPDNIAAALTPPCMLILVFWLDYRLGLLLVLMCVLGFFLYKQMYNAPDLMEKFTASLEKMSAATVEYIRGMQVIKLFGISVNYYKSLIESIEAYHRDVYAYSQACRRPYVLFQVLFNSFYIFAIPISLALLLHGEAPLLILAKLVFFTLFSGVVLNSFMAVMFTGTDNYNAKLALDRLEELMEQMNRAKLRYGSVSEMTAYDIAFADVSFKYEEQYVLENFDLRLEAKKTYALVGPSGSGKSTIAKLISGFYPVEHGKVLIGGRSLGEYTEECLQRNIAFVFQQAKLFKTSIYENVKIARPEASEEQIMEALALANCESILAKFPEREHTVIGSKGVYLSGGEVQRVAIARAILKNAPIVILDEALAATDPENEFEIQQGLANLIKGKTVIMIAHRLSAITEVDEILFIEHGRVTERGDHASLMARNGRYKALQDMYRQSNDWRVA